MKKITIEMLEGKIEANRARIESAQHVIKRKEEDIALWHQENTSFLHCLRILREDSE